MNRILALFIAVSFATTSCVGNASLWGQYATPTPLGGSAPTFSPDPAIFVPETPTAFGPLVVSEAADLIAPTSTITNEAFVTQEVTSLPIENTPANLTNGPTLLYYAQSGDWLPALAKRFGVDVSEIASPNVLPENGLLAVGTLLLIPDRRDQTIQYTSGLQLLPDNEVVFSATALDFDISTYVRDAGGYLSS